MASQNALPMFLRRECFDLPSVGAGGFCFVLAVGDGSGEAVSHSRICFYDACVEVVGGRGWGLDSADMETGWHTLYTEKALSRRRRCCC